MARESVRQCAKSLMTRVALAREIVLKRLSNPSSPLRDEKDVQVYPMLNGVGPNRHYPIVIVQLLTNCKLDATSGAVGSKKRAVGSE